MLYHVCDIYSEPTNMRCKWIENNTCALQNKIKLYHNNMELSVVLYL